MTLAPYDPSQTARQSSGYNPESTVEDAAHRFLGQFVADLDDDDARGVYDYDRLTVREYMVAGNGPSAWFYVVSDLLDGDIKEIFLLYSEGTAAAVRVPPHYWASLYRVLESDRVQARL